MRASLRTIAKESGVSVATVSFALRGLPKVDPATRERVLSVAKRMGYVRDPQLANALAFARRRNKPIYRETLAFLIDAPAARLKQDEEMTWLRDIHAGASQCAQRLGYGVELISYAATPKAQRTQARQLQARGIRGLVCTPGLVRQPFALEYDWTRFAAVEIGQTLENSLLPRIVRDHVGDYLAMLQDLRGRGYRRIGLGITDWEEARHQWSILAAYLAFHDRHPDQTTLPVLPSYGREAFLAWVKKSRPDVVVVNGAAFEGWLRAEGFLVPEKIGVCRIDSRGGSDSGLRPDYTGIGHAAIGLLAANLERGEMGASAGAAILCIPNGWHEGDSLRPRPTGSASFNPRAQ